GRDRRYAIDRVGEFLALDIEDLVVVDRDDPVVIGKGAVDQLRGQRRLTDRAADLGLAERDLDLVLAFLDEFSQFDHRLARHDDPGHAGGAFGRRYLDPRQAMP